MREAERETQGALDRALSRAFGARRTADRAGVPPAPHLPARTPEPPLAPGASGPGVDDSPAGTPSLIWPPTVRTLERRYHERFSTMADLLIEARDRQHLKVLLFTSCHRAEGRTSLVLTLARALARRPGRTVLVDADLTGPMLARLLGLRPEVGLDDVVNDGLPLADALVDSPDDNLAVLPLRAPVGHPREFLASTGWSQAITRLRREFDLVVLDGSPLFAGLSETAVPSSVDAAVLVHSRILTGERALVRARDVLDASGVPLLGTAETFA